MKNKLIYCQRKGYTVKKTTEVLGVSRQTVFKFERINKLKFNREVKKSIFLKTILRKLYNRGYKDKSASVLLGCDRRYITDIKNKFSLRYKVGKPLSKRHKSIIIGTLLGDAYIQTRGESIRLSLHHSTKQEEFCEWKKELLSCFNWASKYYTKMHKYTSVKYDTYKDHRLKEFSYKNKQIIKKWLNYYNSLSLAIHFMDDGSKAGNSYVLCTHSFNNKSLQLFNEMCRRKFNIEWNIKKDNSLYLPVRYAQRFRNLVIPHIHKTMLYKI